MTGPQLRVLILIFRGGPTTPGAVAAELNVHPSNATRVCSRLERAGFIRRVPAGADRRLRNFELTPAGEELVAEVISSRRSTVKRIVDRLSPSQAADLSAALGVFAIAATDAAERDGELTLGGLHLATVTESLPPPAPATPTS
ncbi:MAG TPA: MarR family transcriptional regulator [Galbitalea sp.]